MKVCMLSGVYAADGIRIAERKTRSRSGLGRHAMRRRIPVAVGGDDNSEQDVAALKNGYCEISSRRANA